MLSNIQHLYRFAVFKSGISKKVKFFKHLNTYIQMCQNEYHSEIKRKSDYLWIWKMLYFIFENGNAKSKNVVYENDITSKNLKYTFGA